MKILQGMRDLGGQYSNYLIDIWGVIHNGQTPYPGVQAALQKMKQAGGRILLLSNAPRPAALVAKRLREIGVDDDWYDDLYTSGDETKAFLFRRAQAQPDRPVRYYYFGPAIDRDIYVSSSVERTETLDEADLVLSLAWSMGGQVNLWDHDAELDTMQRRGLTMLCANPDKIVHHAGREEWCAGALAERFQERGGQVVYCGKPFPDVYTSALERLGSPDQATVLMIGDSLRTDIAGARAFGIASCLVAQGIHGPDFFGTAADALSDEDALARLTEESVHDVCARFHRSSGRCMAGSSPDNDPIVIPNYTLRQLQW